MKAKDLGTRMISAVPPRYPTESRRQREQGTVVLELTLDADGRVAHIAVARSSGFSRLDEAALRAVRKWRWAPTMRDGQAVMVQGLVEIPFVLKG
jgi:protein TonB